MERTPRRVLDDWIACRVVREGRERAPRVVAGRSGDRLTVVVSEGNLRVSFQQ